METRAYKASKKKYNLIEDMRETTFLDGKTIGFKNAQLQLAKSLKDKGFSIELIVEVTGISSEEVTQL